MHVQVRLGLVLLRDGKRAGAEAVARRILADRPEHAEGLLALGLAQRAAGHPEGLATLRHFLAVAPGHPAAAQVQRLIAGS